MPGRRSIVLHPRELFSICSRLISPTTTPLAASRGLCLSRAMYATIFAAACLAAAPAAATQAPGQTSATQVLIDATMSDVFHVDLHARGKRLGDKSMEGSKGPWFDGFVEGMLPAAATIGHPIRRMLVHLKEEQVSVEEATSWARGQGMFLRVVRVGVWVMVRP